MSARDANGSSTQPYSELDGDRAPALLSTKLRTEKNKKASLRNAKQAETNHTKHDKAKLG